MSSLSTYQLGDKHFIKEVLRRMNIKHRSYFPQLRCCLFMFHGAKNVTSLLSDIWRTCTIPKQAKRFRRCEWKRAKLNKTAFYTIWKLMRDVENYCEQVRGKRNKMSVKLYFIQWKKWKTHSKNAVNKRKKWFKICQ